MGDVRGMGGRKRASGLYRDVNRFAELYRPLADQLSPCAAFDALADDVMQRASIGRHCAYFINCDDIWMVERGRGARLLSKALNPLRIFGKTRRQQLERDLPFQTRIARQIDLTH